MKDIDTVARLHPGIGTSGFKIAEITVRLDQNKRRYVAQKREHAPLAVAQPLDSDGRQDREGTQDPEEHDSVDYTPCLEISLSQVPKTSLGLVAGWDPKADIVLPATPGVSFHHFSLTFDDAYRLVVRDLGSRAGTSVIYDGEDGGPRSNFQWIIGGDENLEGRNRIVIKVIKSLQFKIIVNKYDTDSEALRAQVDIFRAGTADLADTLGDLDVRPPTRLPTGIHTPAKEDVLLKRKIGQGGFAVVYHTWNASTGDVYALKEPLEKLRKNHVKAWKNEALLMGRVSHDHIVKLLGSNTKPSPSLRFEYLTGGSLRQHLKDGRYFSGVECNEITKQSLSALAYLHELEPSITHRDLSDGNILVQHRSADRIVIKLGDFGISKEGPQLNTIVGTPYFLPPEFFIESIPNMRLTGARYTPAIDIWALAAVIAKLLCGRPKHTDAHEKDGRLRCQDIRHRVEKFFRQTKDALAQHLLDAMLCIEPEMRQTARECYNGSLQLPDGSRDTWRGRTPILVSASDEKEDEWKEEDKQRETAIFLGSRNPVVDRTMEKVTADPEMSDGNAPPDQPGSRLSEGCSVTASVGDLYRSGAPPPSTLSGRGTELHEILGKMSDPEASLFVKSDIGDESQFSDDTESNPYTATPRRPNPNQPPTLSTSALIQPEGYQHASAVVPRKRKAAAAPSARASQALDVSQLVAKLESIPQEREITARGRRLSQTSSSPPAARSRTQSPDPGIGKAHQIRCYHWLIRAGGRPLCSLETLEEIYKNPDAYMEMLRAWWRDWTTGHPDTFGVFSRQLERWKEFRDWQRYNRGVDATAEESFAAFLDEERCYFESTGLSSITARPDFERTMHNIWQDRQVSRKLKGERYREVPQGGFAEYTDAARRRLARHGFAQPFQFLEDPEQQDERVTWIEYLEFECWWLDDSTRYALAWKKRLGAGGKRACAKHETAEIREANQRLRVQWILSEMPAVEEALKTTGAALDGEAGATGIRATGKRKRGVNEDKSTGETTGGSVEAAAKRQKQSERGERGTAWQEVGRKGSRMLLGLDTPVARTRVPRKDGVRRSARIKNGKK
ncbi:hypothetical protein F5Y10DRAFT_275726 [Nemania abortiva]|nr:hypothetical protein F5Y10DRAFT_275726 [Nemania abortiva]